MSRQNDRAAAAAGALLLQAGFIAAFLHAFSQQTPPQQLQRELTFFLPRLLPKPAPIAQTPPAPRAPSTPTILSVIPPLRSLRPAPPAATPSQANIENFGRALFGCAPEKYFNLTPQQRALCPPPGQGMAIREAPPLEGLPSQVKDNPRWANALAHEKSPLLLPGASPDKFGLNVLTIHRDGTVSGLLPAITNGSIADTETWPTSINPDQFMPLPPLKAGKTAPAQTAGADPQ